MQDLEQLPANERAAAEVGTRAQKQDSTFVINKEAMIRLILSKKRGEL